VADLTNLRGAEKRKLNSKIFILSTLLCFIMFVFIHIIIINIIISMAYSFLCIPLYTYICFFCSKFTLSHQFIQTTSFIHLSFLTIRCAFVSSPSLHFFLFLVFNHFVNLLELNFRSLKGAFDGWPDTIMKFNNSLYIVYI